MDRGCGNGQAPMVTTAANQVLTNDAYLLANRLPFLPTNQPTMSEKVEIAEVDQKFQESCSSDQQGIDGDQQKNGHHPIGSGDGIIKVEKSLLIWAKERDNYVTPMNIVAFQIKSPAKFGWKSAPYFGFEEGPGGVLCLMDWATLMKYRPTTLEITEPCAPLAEFLSNVKDGDNFFSRVRWLRIYESNADVDQVRRIIEMSKTLAVVELYESGFGMEERKQLLKPLSTKMELKAFDFVFDFDGPEMNEWFSNLRTKLRIVRFSGPPAVKLSTFKTVKIDLPAVEFAALQDLEIDVNTEDPKNKTWHRDLLNRFCHMLPSVKFFFLDYKIFDTVFIYDDGGKAIFESIRDFFLRLKLVCFAILIYAPDDDIKASVDKAAKFLVESEIRTEVKQFFCGSIDEAQSAPPNFRLLVLGDQVHARTVRLVETVVDQRITNPDLRHFSYVIDLEAFLRPNSTVAFGGFDKNVVEETYKEKHASVSTPEFVPDTVLSRNVQG